MFVVDSIVRKDRDETICWCYIVTGNSTLIIGLDYRRSSMNEEDDTKNAAKEVSNSEYIIMRDLIKDTYN